MSLEEYYSLLKNELREFEANVLESRMRDGSVF